MKRIRISHPITCVAVMVLLFVGAATSVRADDAASFDPGRFERQVLVAACSDPMQIEVLGGGDVLFIERGGLLKRYRAKTNETVVCGRVPSTMFGEVGLLGLALADDFAATGHIFLFFCPEAQSDTMRLSRFKLIADMLDLASEKKLFDYAIQTEPAIHMGGGLTRDDLGNLYLGTGDNSPPMPEPPLDQRPGKENRDSQRSSANSQDLRGKVLRIHPEPDGTYTIPEGNLFADPTLGRPEIYAMGCRNPFRQSVDSKTHWVYWGDVGPNCEGNRSGGPVGYDEINQARKAGNFGWPMFIGPNESFREFDFATNQVGPEFNPAHPVNRSRNNTGIRDLPPAQPALIWYPSGESAQFPQLGSGGRSAMVGPVYHDRSAYDPTLKLPEALEGRLFVMEWMRNLILTAAFDKNGDLATLEPFLPAVAFRKPIDMKLGPDGTMYLIEIGDKWTGNTDSQIVRFVYRRGNRAPRAAIELSTTAGKEPLHVEARAIASDADGDAPLDCRWQVLHHSEMKAHGPAVAFDFTERGTYRLELSVSDPHGATTVVRRDIHVGNSAPVVQFTMPEDGTFFDWHQPIGYGVTVRDEEDGSTENGRIASERVLVEARFLVNSASARGSEGDAAEPGLALMRKTTCFSCHTTGAASAGPPYASVAVKYRGQGDAREKLAQKIIAGGAGTWGEKPMPPHPQHTLVQTRQMVDWVLSLIDNPSQAPQPGTENAVMAPVDQKASRRPSGVCVLTAAYADQGFEDLPSLRSEASVILHARRKNVATADRRHQVEVVDVFEKKVGVVGRFRPESYLMFERVNLGEVARVGCRASLHDAQAGASIDLRLDDPAGPIVASIPVDSVGTLAETEAPVQATSGLHDLYLTVNVQGAETNRPVLDLSWIEFHLSADVEKARAAKYVTLRRQMKQWAARPAPAPSRPFVRAWKYDDLQSLVSTLHGRNFERGRELFRVTSCASCHRLRGEGGKLGPDLTEVSRRVPPESDPTHTILRDMLEPSRAINEKYRTTILTLDDGRQLSGVVFSEDAKTLRIASNPLAPDQLQPIAVVEIDERGTSAVSMMPEGLLNTLTDEEILDLLAYVISGGDPTHILFHTRE